MKKPIDINYLDNETDLMWRQEAEKLIPWLYGAGADIGCGQRSVKRGSIRVDIDSKVKPDVCCPGDKLPFKDNELNYITAVHAFEHIEDQSALLKEWLRVIKPGGIIAIVHPDLQYTGKQVQEGIGSKIKNDPHNTHYFEKTENEFVKMLESVPPGLFNILDHGPACPNWSFFIILEKI